MQLSRQPHLLISFWLLTDAIKILERFMHLLNRRPTHLQTLGISSSIICKGTSSSHQSCYPLRHYLLHSPTYFFIFQLFPLALFSFSIFLFFAILFLQAIKHDKLAHTNWIPEMTTSVVLRHNTICDWLTSEHAPKPQSMLAKLSCWTLISLHHKLVMHTTLALNSLNDNHAFNTKIIVHFL